MSTKKTSQYPKEIPFRSIARAIGLLALITGILYATFLFDDFINGIPNLLPNMLLVLLGTLGMALGWAWEREGGVIGIIAGISVAILVFSTASGNNLYAAIVYGSPFVVGGLLYLIDYLGNQEQRPTFT